MKRSFKAFVLAVLLAAPLLGSCNDNITSPIEPASSAQIERQDGLLLDLLNVATGLLGNVVNLLGSILSGPDANGSAVSAWIGPEGGTIQTAAYTLTVPQGAVTKRTRFVMEPSNNGKYMLELRAYEQGLLFLIDVGERGFKKPVLLTISYKNAKGVRDENRLGIVYVFSSTHGELQPSEVDRQDREVTARLKHFSKYAMVQN